ncbi:hypothetical protein AB1Y20_004147 [Prymnesium parvum]|uniref:Uncharacterized protein n=1 Tax=Prymnesium parvum TaxID=97485 RepID=A0AB34J6T1_PRYPA
MSACVDCQDAKAEAEAKAAATRPQDDGLNLGDCAPLYREWADCIEREGVGTGAKACMKPFTPPVGGLIARSRSLPAYTPPRHLLQSMNNRSAQKKPVSTRQHSACAFKHDCRTQ